MPPSTPPAAPRLTALVTGASSGIGFDLAHVLARHGYDLVLVARTEPALRDLARTVAERYGATATVIPADLRDPNVPGYLFERTEGTGLAIDALINNAGFGLGGPFERTDGQVELEMIQVNVTALTALTKLFLPAMLARRRGRIMNVASTAAFQPGPFMAVYYATKAYVLSFTEAIAEEVHDTGVTLTALCPGPTYTGFMHVAGVHETPLFARGVVMQSREVAEYGYKAMERGTRVAIPGPINRLVAFSSRLAPRALVTRIARKIQEQRY